MRKIIKKIKEIFASPSTFFESLEKEQGMKPAFVYLLVLSSFFVIISFLGIILFQKTQFEETVTQYINLSTYSLWYVLGMYFLAMSLSLIVGNSIGALFLFIWLYMFKGKRPYSIAYKLLTYANTPLYLFGWIPFLGIGASIYSFILLIIGTKQLYKFSSLKATLIYLIPLFIMVLLLLIIVVFALMTLSSLVDLPIDITQKTF